MFVDISFEFDSTKEEFRNDEYFEKIYDGPMWMSFHTENGLNIIKKFTDLELPPIHERIMVNHKFAAMIYNEYKNNHNILVEWGGFYWLDNNHKYHL